ncbi:cytochrome P450 [Deinococcus sonorensis]|uniref:Cytochrome P450 n=2 Tax=Deinococcus sonorensis TaxID=309891 RepID=A0AAU7U6Y3_9DEIO
MTQTPDAAAPGCPFHASTGSKTVQPDAPRPDAAVTIGSQGYYRIHGLDATRQVLRSEAVQQAGLGAEQVRQVQALHHMPVLYMEGEQHHEMRRQTARYFTPVAVAGYQQMMGQLADRLIADFAARGEARLDDLSLQMAVEVAARVVGLTDSLLPGLARRVTGFVSNGMDSAPGAAQPQSPLRQLASQRQMLAFYLLDVTPAIRVRRREVAAGRPRDDLISHLIQRQYSDLEILTECLTYGTAGMVTTREFIQVAAWHFLDNPELKHEYLHAPEAERHRILHELLRLEPVVAQLYRRAVTDLTVAGVPIPQGSVIELDVTAANTDPQELGDTALEICPGRPLPRGVQPPVMSFGDGHHRCPGAYLAIRESDVFLRRLLMLDVQLVRPPQVSRNETVKGYELRDFRLRLA